MIDFYAATPLHVSDLAADEIEKLGGKIIKISRSGVHFKGMLECGYQVCLWSRICDRVILKISNSEIIDGDSLYRAALKVEWGNHFTLKENFSVRFASVGEPSIDRTHGMLKTKDAIADWFNREEGERPNVERDNPDIVVDVFCEQGNASFGIDLTREPLNKRGYRQRGGIAALRENAAAALLYRSKWHELYKEGECLIDPMCGSGTIAIEAAMMASDCAPGLLREQWGFSWWRGHDSTLWENIFNKAKSRFEAGKKSAPRIWGFDKDSLAIKNAIENSNRSLVTDLIHFEKMELNDFIAVDAMKNCKGIFVTNPPYGKRIGESSHLKGLYRLLGQKISEQLPQWKMSMITSEKELSMATGLHATRINKLYNGQLECLVSHFDYLNITEIELSDAEIQLQNRLKKRYKELSKWARKNEVTCYRFYDADMPDYNAAVDLYEGKWVHMQEYEPPVNIDLRKRERRMNQLMSAVSKATSIPLDAIYLKTRSKQSRSKQYEKLEESKEKFIITESGYKFWANFTDYLDTGLFLDHRPARKMIMDMAIGKRFLNLYCYTATASVLAAAGGAFSTMSVDTSKTYLEWGKENMELNRLMSNSQRFQREDSIAYLTRTMEMFDLIFIDPPTFSNNKSAGRIFDVQKDHIELITLALKRLNKGGTIIFSNNFRKFKMEYTGGKGITVKDISAQTIPQDFLRNSKIHKCWLIEKR